MGKNKKAKTLTQEEIWDDSALLQSWDEAVEEYQLYHSIHAKGENVEDALREAEESGLIVEGEIIEAEVEVDAAENDAITANEDTSMNIDEPAQASQPVNGPGPGVSTTTPPMPHPAMANVQDEALKNLMMSWYYAGYYTGVYEGQQQATREKRS
ncbi:hypothetical protein PENARI_c017G05052 [Penicillium arizonense]|uniref:Survival Motor Neuron Gemin2-binding domain-containing protein n=1 Tax=Penicillium arizonense TaxID=1835702 RepID=A0A1F5LB89_PENAI|nr:hypothetical protein PENARI_c017G05052 [Penicillium arizonense]OGE50462.1 hypothetical protein PENARI_c017G05052 [Penicillium arizonense]